jgi:hypothetical protein
MAQSAPSTPLRITIVAARKGVILNIWDSLSLRPTLKNETRDFYVVREPTAVKEI